MVQRRHLIIFLLTVVVVAGCSEETPLPPRASAPAASPPAAEPAPVLAEATPLPPAPPPDIAVAAVPASSDESALAALTPAVDMSDLFTPPKLEDRVVEVAPPPLPPPPEPVPVEPGLPPLRLVGFVDVEEQQALLSIAGTVRLMRVGDAHAGVQVVRIEPPVLVLKAEGKNEFELNLLEQPWFYQPSPAASGARGSGNVGAVRSSRPTASGTRSPFPRQSPPPPVPAFPPQPPAATPAPPAMPPPVSPPKAPPIGPLPPKTARSSTAGG